MLYLVYFQPITPWDIAMWRSLMGIWLAALKTLTAGLSLQRGGTNRPKKFVHVHAIFCTRGYCQEQAISTYTSPLSSALSSSSALPLQHMKTMELNSSLQFLYHFISPALRNVINACNASSWPSLLYPTASACGLCRHNLGNKKLSILAPKGRLTWLLLQAHFRKWKSE